MIRPPFIHCLFFLLFLIISCCESIKDIISDKSPVPRTLSMLTADKQSNIAILIRSVRDQQEALRKALISDNVLLPMTLPLGGVEDEEVVDDDDDAIALVYKARLLPADSKNKVTRSQQRELEDSEPETIITNRFQRAQAKNGKKLHNKYNGVDNNIEASLLNDALPPISEASSPTEKRFYGGSGRRGCDFNTMTTAKFREFLSTGRLCGQRMGGLRFALTG